jgi:hypothetical protein
MKSTLMKKNNAPGLPFRQDGPAAGPATNPDARRPSLCYIQSLFPLRCIDMRRLPLERPAFRCGMAVLAILLPVIAPASGRCDSLAARLDAVRVKAEDGRTAEAFEELKRVELELWRLMTSLSARRLELIEEEPPPDGAYRPRVGNLFRKGEPVRIALEPVGYVLKEEDGLYRLLLTTDFTVVDDRGNIYGGQRDFGRWEAASRRPVTEFLMFFTYDLGGLAPGEYVIETVVRDAYSDRTLELATPVVIAE